MNIFRCFTVIGTAVVRATLWLVNGVQSISKVVRGVFQGAVRSGGSLLRATWRHPVVTTATIVSLGASWLFLGWTPLLSALSVVGLLGLTVRFGVGLYRWLTAGSTMPPLPMPPNPLRNGKPANRSVNSVPAGVS
jgi:hypothetical protein